MSATVTIDRSEFDEIIVSLGALGGFADRIYAGGSFDSMLCNEALDIQRRLIEYAGLPETDQARDEVWYQREVTRERALVAKYVEAVAS